MYTVQQLQALDVLLKILSADSSHDFKAVIEYSGQLWQGDFVTSNRTNIHQPYVDSIGDLETKITKVDDHESHKAIAKVWEHYCADVTRYHKLTTPENPAYLYHELVRILDDVTYGEEESSLHPYLYNAKTVGGTVELPFIDLAGDRLRLVSILRIKK